MPHATFTHKRLALALAVLACLMAVVVALPLLRAQAEAPDGHLNGSAFIVRDIAQQDGMTVLTGTLDQPLPEGDTAFFQTNGTPLIISLNGQVAFARTEGNAVQLEAFGYGWDSFRTTQQETGSTIKVVACGANSDTAVRKLAESLFVGNSMDLFRLKLQAHAFQLLGGLLIVMLGLAYIMLILILRHIKKDIPGNYLACGVMLVAGGACSVIDYDYLPLIIENISALNWADFLTQAMSLACLLIYLHAFLTQQRLRKAAGALAPIFALALATCCGLVASGIASLHECVTVLIPLGTFMLVAMLALLLADYRGARDAKTKLLLQSGALLAACALVEMVHFMLTGSYWIIVFQCGLLLFGVLQFFILARNAEEQLLRGERMEKAEAELAQNRIKIMLSQIQPHFLYNTLAGIARLCDKDPRQAKQAIVEFADYLRGNMDSLSQTAPMPFERELRHVRLYLSLEQMRFGDDLQVVYDIETTDFTLPALSVQPLVENAVRYGVGKREDGGTVRITTRQLPQSVTVTVEDDGVGFDPRQTQDDGRTHIGIDSVAARCRELSQATLDIESHPGQGTTATITIPREVDHS